MCFKYRWPPYDGDTLEWCTTSTDPEPPPPPDPGPPPTGYPDDYDGLAALLFAEGGGGSCWDAFPAVGPDFDAGIGPWGGWGMVFESSTIGDIFMEVFVVSWVPGAYTWRCNWEVFGGGSGHLDVLEAAGFSPDFFFGAGGIGDCPDANLTLITSVPP